MRIKLDPYAIQPTRAHETDAGLDIMAPRRARILPYGNVIIKTGVHVELPPNTAGVIVSKSGLNVKNSVTSTGLIDQGYTGEIIVKLYNHDDQDVFIERGQKITQLVVIPVLYEPVEIADEISGGERGDNGFGSTGK